MKTTVKILAVLALVIAGVVIAAPATTVSEWINTRKFHSPGHVEMDSSLNKGIVTVGANGDGGTYGQGFVTVATGATCACSEQTDIAAKLTCSVTGTTLTVLGTPADLVSYVCL